MRKLKDNYKIYVEKFLGTGAYSRVYICKYIGPHNTQIPRNIDLAIKIIHIKDLSKKTIKIINEEIKITKILMKYPYPNIVEYYDIIRDMVIDDMIEQYEYTPEDAGDFADSNTCTIIDRMWDAYSDELVNLAEE